MTSGFNLRCLYFLADGSVLIFVIRRLKCKATQTKKGAVMNKTDLVNEVSKVVKTKKEAEALVKSIFQAISKALSNGEAVTLIGFGTFKSVKRAARTGRNPQNGKPIKIKASNAARFTPGKALKDAVN